MKDELTKDELLEVFDSRHLHQSIVKESRVRFSNCDFWAAILSAGIFVETRVRSVSGLTDLYGRNLMAQAFDANDPKIKLSDTSDEQEGFKLVFMGMIHGIRDPKAHDSHFTQRDPVKTLEYLGFLSLLLRRIDERV